MNFDDLLSNNKYISYHCLSIIKNHFRAVPNFHLGINIPSLDNVETPNCNKEVTGIKATANFHNVSVNREVPTNTILMPKRSVKDLEAQNSANSVTSDTKVNNLRFICNTYRVKLVSFEILISTFCLRILYV